MIKALPRLIVAINANSRPAEIAAGAAFGVLLALVPGSNLHWYAFFAISFLVKMNLAAIFLVMGLARLAAPLADPALDGLGWFVLSLPSLQPAFTALARLSVLPWARFSDTVVMGGLLAGLALWAPVFLLLLFLVRLYRRRFRERIAASRLARAIAKVPLLATLAKAVGAASGAAGLGG